MPAGDRPTGAWPALPAPDAEHDADDHERTPWGVGVDQGLRAARIEEAPARPLPPLGVEVPHAAAAKALRRARHIARTGRSGQRRQCPHSRAGLREQAPGSRALGSRCECRRRVLAEVVDQTPSRPRWQHGESRAKLAEDRGRTGRRRRRCRADQDRDRDCGECEADRSTLEVPEGHKRSVGRPANTALFAGSFGAGRGRPSLV